MGHTKGSVWLLPFWPILASSFGSISSKLVFSVTSACSSSLSRFSEGEKNFRSVSNIRARWLAERWSHAKMSHFFVRAGPYQIKLKMIWKHLRRYSLGFEGRVALMTGAGGGLARFVEINPKGANGTKMTHFPKKSCFKRWIKLKEIVFLESGARIRSLRSHCSCQWFWR